MLLVLRKGGILDGIVNEVASAWSQRGGEVEGWRHAEAAELESDFDIVQDARRVDGKVVERRRDLPGQEVGSRGILLRGNSLGDTQLLGDCLDGTGLVLGVQQERVCGVHGGHEPGQEGGFSLVAQGRLANGEGAGRDGGDDVGDTGEDVGSLARWQGHALDSEGIGEDRGIYSSAVGKNLIDQGRVSLGSSTDGLWQSEREKWLVFVQLPCQLPCLDSP